MYEQSITELREQLNQARERLNESDESRRPLYNRLDAAENALMEQVLRQLHDGGNFIVLAAQVHGITEGTQYEMQNCSRSLADRLGRYFGTLALTTHWPPLQTVMELKQQPQQAMRTHE